MEVSTAGSPEHMCCVVHQTNTCQLLSNQSCLHHPLFAAGPMEKLFCLRQKVICNINQDPWSMEGRMMGNEEVDNL